MAKVIKAYTDGSCLGNPGVGGFASIIDNDGMEKIVKGYSTNPHSTNNGMELAPVLYTLIWCARNVDGPCTVEIYTDSNYPCSCWKHDKHWLMTDERPNSKYWIQIITVCEKHKINLKFIKVPGHSGIERNERADKIAREQAIKARHIVFGGKNGRG